MIVFLFFLCSTDKINFYVDPVVYRSTIEISDTVTQITKKEEVYYIEFNCGIPYHELSYETMDSIITSKAIIAFRIVNSNTRDSLIDTLRRQFRIPSFSEAAREQISFIVQFGMLVPEGTFNYRIEILSGEKKGYIEKALAIKKENYRMSDILLANEITIDSSTAVLRKGKLRVVPHPSRNFNERYKNLYAYYEIYDVIPDTTKLNVMYKIVNKKNEIVRKVTQLVDKKFDSQAVNLGISIEGFEPGEYRFIIEVMDTFTKRKDQKELSFSITKRPQQEVSYEGLPYYDKVEYFINQKDYAYFKSLPEEGKRIFLKKFWAQNDYYDIAARFEYADEHYREGRKQGNETDRGRIHIKYGAPDEIEKSFLEHEESKPYEKWQYYNGVQFIFVDIRSTNEYTLVWTNVSDESSQPTLYRYLPKSLREQIE